MEKLQIQKNNFSVSDETEKKSLSSEQKWFLEISRTHFGIHQRAKKLLEKFYDSPLQQKWVNEELRRISLNDLWFYKSYSQKDRAIKFLIHLFEELLSKDLQVQNKQRVFTTFLEFTGELFPQQEREMPFRSSVKEVIRVLEKALSDDPCLRIYASGFLKNIPVQIVEDGEYTDRLILLLKRTLGENIQMWQNHLDFQNWSLKKTREFYQTHTAKINQMAKKEKELIRVADEKLSQANSWKELKNVPDFKGFVNGLHVLIDEAASGLEKIYFIYYLLDKPGLTIPKDDFFAELAQALKCFPSQVFNLADLNHFLLQIFFLFDKSKSENMERIIECISKLGKKIYDTEEKTKIALFIDHLIQFGFVYPQITGIDQEWQIQTDSNHLKNIRLWLELIGYSPELSSKLIAALIVNLKIGGVLIRDDNLFQRDISRLLNSEFKSNYALVKQLISLFPVYYSSIGAEGRIREISTEIDKISFSGDRLIHFLRKQVHSDSNNTHIDLVKGVFYFWYDGNAEPLLPYLPLDVRYGLAACGKWFNPVHQMINKLCEQMKITPEVLLEKDIHEIERTIEQISAADQVNNKRLLYLIELYQLLKHKYTLDFKYISTDLKKADIFSPKEVERLEKDIQSKEYIPSIKKIYQMILSLKKITLGTDKSEAEESIYYKRHIASGIPSMYGNYSEKKFEAMGLIFRLEKLADFIIKNLIDQTNLEYMTIDGFRNAAKLLELFKEGFAVNGISNENFNSNLEMLNYSFTTKTFSMEQFVNIFYFLNLNIKQIIETHCILPFKSTLKMIIPQYIDKNKTDENNQASQEHIFHKKSETFYRDIIVSSFLVQHLDNYISKILITLKSMLEKLDPEVIQMLLKYNPKLLSTSFHQPTPEVDNQIFLGAKAYYLKKLYSYQFPVPPGFVLTTEWFRNRKAIIQFPEMYEAIIIKMIKDKIAELEKLTKKKYGDPDNPLLLSVRSGTVIPMPGAMDTILNIGMNDHIADHLSRKTGYGWAAWDSYRRLLQNWGMSHGIARDEFDQIIIDFKNTHDVKEKKDFTQDQMKSIAFSYKDLLFKYGIKLEEDPFKQLIQAIIFVLQSWYNKRAQIFRKKLQIAEEWGTAVIVQEMVFGNIGSESGTGVVFTKMPFEKSSEVALYGDFTSCSQGEDIVSGLVYTLPVSEYQNQKHPQRKGDSLEKQFPEIYQELLRLAKELIYQRGYAHQEIEFTFKSNKKEDLYILQTRQYSLKENDKIPIFKEPSVHSSLVGTGIGIGRGVINGIVAFDMEDLELLDKKYPSQHKILIRPDTVPDDIGMIFECDGLLTARGGMASHAAVTAAQLGKICVVNCKELIVMEKEKKCMINNTVFCTGDQIAIDGYLGNIYKGNHAITLEKITLF